MSAVLRNSSAPMPSGVSYASGGRDVKILGVVPARGGSKRVPRKNIRIVHGRPLLEYTLDAAAASRRLASVVVSTEDGEIADVAQRLGFAVLARPAALATDEARGVEPALHAIETFPEYSHVVLLQPTSPLRRAEDIDGAIDTCVRLAAPACVSVCPAEQSPFWMYWVDERNRLKPVLADDSMRAHRSQDLPTAYALNGAVYVARCDWLRTARTFVTPETVPYFMRSAESLDVDTEEDLLRLEEVLGERGRRGPSAPA